MKTNIEKYEEIIDRCFHILGKWRDEDETLRLYQDSCIITLIDDEETEPKTDDEIRYILGEAIASTLQEHGFIVVYFCGDNALLQIEGNTPAFQKEKDYFEPDSEIIDEVKVYWTED